MFVLILQSVVRIHTVLFWLYKTVSHDRRLCFLLFCHFQQWPNLFLTRFLIQSLESFPTVHLSSRPLWCFEVVLYLWCFEMSGSLIHSHNRSLCCLIRRWYLTTANFQVFKSHACQDQKLVGLCCKEATRTTLETGAKKGYSRAVSLEASSGSAEVFLAHGFV